MPTDRFAHKADTYDQSRQRVDNVDNIAQAMLASVPLAPTQHILDFGSGTGLLLEKIAPHVGRMTAVDISPAMNRQLHDKRDRLGCPLDILEIDLATTRLALEVDGIVSSMTLHHIRDIDALFRTFHGLVKAGGFIALADLDREDGSFHAEDTGVFHHGFDRDAIAETARRAGFSDVRVSTASVVNKPQGDYGVFLLTARRR